MEVFLYLLLILPAALYLSAGYAVYRRLFTRRRCNKPYDCHGKDPVRAQAHEQGLLWLKAHPGEDVCLSCGGITLRGHFFSQDSPTTVLLAHGYNSIWKSRLSDAPFYYARGHNLLLIDQRAHGESGGRRIGMGALEKDDLLEWMRWIREKSGDNCRILLDGVSMGGATVLLAAGAHPPENLRAVVSDCAYTNAYAQCAYLAGHEYSHSWAKGLLLPLVNLYCRLLAGYSLTDASPLDAVARTEVPIFFLHGQEDHFVPTAMAEELFRACTSGKKELLLVPGARHAAARSHAPALCYDAISRFLDGLGL